MHPMSGESAASSDPTDLAGSGAWARGGGPPRPQGGSPSGGLAGGGPGTGGTGGGLHGGAPQPEDAKKFKMLLATL